MAGSGVAPEVGTFPELNRVMNLVAAQDAFAQPGSIMLTVSTHREPSLGLSGVEQELLGAALAGQTDAELAAGLHLTMPAVKARWRAIFARFEQRSRRWPRRSSGRVGEVRRGGTGCSPGCARIPRSCVRSPASAA